MDGAGGGDVSYMSVPGRVAAVTAGGKGMDVHGNTK